ncbi:MAG: NfeD family protein [Phycisphaeraceae bacterium]
MPTTTRRVLTVLVLIAGLLPWLTGPSQVRAQDGPADDKPAQQDTPGDGATPPSARTASALTLSSTSMIAIVEIDGPIYYKHQFESIQRRADRAINDGADLIVFDFDTPGGRLDLALDISNYILNLQKPTVAWIDDQALSAGILIASACDEIVMSRTALAGDCAPIVPGRNLAPTERSKALTPLLAQFRAHAQANHSGPTTSDYALFHAMCELGVEVYQVRHKITGETRLVSQADYAVLVDGVSPIDASNTTKSTTSAITDPDDANDAQPDVTVTDASEAGQWEPVKQVHNGGQLLTLTASEALDLGLSRQTVSNEVELEQRYGAGSVRRYDETWSESLVGFLVHPVVRAGLLLVGIAGLLLEYLSPGLFFPGIIGLAAIVTLIGAPFLVGLAQTWHLVLIVVGAGLVIYELFTMTTFGVLAVIGLLMFMAGLVLSGVQTASNGLPAPGTGRQVIVTSMAFVGSVLLTVPLLIVLTRYFGSLPLFNKLILNESQQAMIPLEGSAPVPYQRVSGDESVGGDRIKPGMTGRVSGTGLRPAGRVLIDDELIDVTSTGGYVEPGTAVRVVEVHGNMIRVEPIDEASA